MDQPVRVKSYAYTEPPGSAEALAPCAVSPEARYRWVENQVYRVEVHQGGLAVEGASFKWSRENASVPLPVTSVSGTELKLAAWWRDARLDNAGGNSGEVFDDADSLRGRPRPLSRVSRWWIATPSRWCSRARRRCKWPTRAATPWSAAGTSGWTPMQRPTASRSTNRPPLDWCWRAAHGPLPDRLEGGAQPLPHRRPLVDPGAHRLRRCRCTASSTTTRR